jgi:hypothetical protein
VLSYILEGFSFWVGCRVKVQKILFLMGGKWDERVKDSFPYGWAAGRRGAKYNVLELFKIVIV